MDKIACSSEEIAFYRKGRMPKQELMQYLLFLWQNQNDDVCYQLKKGSGRRQ